MRNGGATPSRMLISLILEETKMTEKTDTMSSVRTEPLTALLTNDRLAFREALDLVFEALRADWLVHQHRKNMDTDEGQELVHQSATAWCTCNDALGAFVAVKGAAADLKAAARELLNVTTEIFPDPFDLLECGSVILKLHHKSKRTNPGLSALLYEAYALTEADRGNLDLMAMHRNSG
jgi:hypothetical protein